MVAGEDTGEDSLLMDEAAGGGREEKDVTTTVHADRTLHMYTHVQTYISAEINIYSLVAGQCDQPCHCLQVSSVSVCVFPRGVFGRLNVYRAEGCTDTQQPPCSAHRQQGASQRLCCAVAVAR